MNELYIKDLQKQYERINFEYFNNKKILITGSLGLICSYLIDLLIYANMYKNANIKIYALGRNKENLKERFNYYYNNELFVPVIQDVCDELKINDEMDIIIHGASNANPNLYITDPVGTMNANYIGCKNLLNFAKNKTSKMVYISSGDVYGNTSKDLILEDDYGYIDILSERSSYASSKRASETLCYSYNKQYDVKVLIARPAHIYGPTFTKKDSRAISDFIRNVINNNDIIMKSDGNSVRSYCYVGDAVVGIMTILEKGIDGNAYNISNMNSIMSIRETALYLANLCNKKLIIDIPDSELNKKINLNTKIIKLSNEKLKKLGWDSIYNINDGLKTTIDILKNN